MKGFLRRIRGLLGMALTSAAGGALVGGVIELIYNLWPGFPLGPLVDMWPMALALVGFVAGGAAATVIAIAGRHRRFDELSLPGFAAWGALGGLALGGLAVAAGFAAPMLPDLWLRALMVMGTTTLASGAAAAGMLALARMGDDRELLDASADVADVGLSDRERKDLLGRGR